MGKLHPLSPARFRRMERQRHFALFQRAGRQRQHCPLMRRQRARTLHLLLQPLLLRRQNLRRAQRHRCRRQLPVQQPGGVLLAERQTEAAIIEFARQQRRQAFRALENSALRQQQTHLLPDLLHRHALGGRPGEFDFDNRH